MSLLAQSLAPTSAAGERRVVEGVRDERRGDCLFRIWRMPGAAEGERRYESSDMADENPPTTKNSGMTWKSQVMTAMPGACSSALPATSSPLLLMAMFIAIQWPSATGSMAIARLRSGLAAAAMSPSEGVIGARRGEAVAVAGRGDGGRQCGRSG